ncbi:hypothetical protein HELRODRAFT_178901 [Helobdella robusta]|uniref:Uncharacterized protein n=1 Tax=Helobdella robusta TaxID=6412 RepID=T1FDV5_HELRO|nr:hypothetical protein HELRODRAFT_178901 [Helobdella robusta]ESN95981.1 hypothetical protein HELRODRAFT_178901 [Helobdella robusta]
MKKMRLNEHGNTFSLIALTENIVAEDLQNSRHLETTIYVTNVHQSADFVWSRDSGLKIHVGVNKVDLWPTFYGNFPPNDDNDFVIGNPVHNENVKMFNKTVAEFCMYPLAEHYQLFMEILTDKATRSEEFWCPIRSKNNNNKNNKNNNDNNNNKFYANRHNGIVANINIDDISSCRSNHNDHNNHNNNISKNTSYGMLMRPV